MGLVGFLFGNSDSKYGNNDLDCNLCCDYCGSPLIEQGFNASMEAWQCFECDTVTEAMKDAPMS